MLLRKKLHSYCMFYYMTGTWLLIFVYPNLIIHITGTQKLVSKIRKGKKENGAEAGCSGSCASSSLKAEARRLFRFEAALAVQCPKRKDLFLQKQKRKRKRQGKEEGSVLRKEMYLC